MSECHVFLQKYWPVCRAYDFEWCGWYQPGFLTNSSPMTAPQHLQQIKDHSRETRFIFLLHKNVCDCQQRRSSLWSVGFSLSDEVCTDAERRKQLIADVLQGPARPLPRPSLTSRCHAACHVTVWHRLLCERRRSWKATTATNTWLLLCTRVGRQCKHLV